MRWHISLIRNAILVVENIVNDFIGSVRQINQNPSKLLLEVILNFSDFFVVPEWILVDPVQEAFHQIDDLGALVYL